MAEPLGRVARLHLGAEQLLHDLLAPVAVADPLDDPVEGSGLDHLAQRELDSEGLEIILERDQLLAARRLVDAVHDRRLLRFERARGGDVGGDHVILDQPVRVEPVARGDRHDPPLLVEHHPALGQIELERIALLPRRKQARQQAHSGFSAFSTSSRDTRPSNGGMSQVGDETSVRSSPAASIAACASS